MWDYVISKAPVSLPKLTIKTQTGRQLDDLLKPVKSLILPSDSESDCSSGIIDTFEEFHRDSFLMPLPGTRTKFLTKLEADWKTVNRFTEDFKKTMAVVRQDLKLAPGLMTEEDAAVEQALGSNEKDCFFKNSQLPFEEAISVDAEPPESESTSNSAVWNMIKAHKRDNFFISPPQYDIYNLNPAHYLERPHVLWEEIEESRKKCEQWLDKCDPE